MSQWLKHYLTSVGVDNIGLGGIAAGFAGVESTDVGAGREGGGVHQAGPGVDQIPGAETREVFINHSTLIKINLSLMIKCKIDYIRNVFFDLFLLTFIP